MNILGISAFFHDSAACLVKDGVLVAAAQEERFTRKKHDEGLPLNAMAYCLHAGKVDPGGIDVLVFYDKPVTKFTRIIRTFAHVAPKGFETFRLAVPSWISQKLWVPAEISRGLGKIGFSDPDKFMYTEHHVSHAASAFFPSPFQSAAVLTVDGVGEWATTAISAGHGNTIKILEEIHFPHSLGLLYSAFTYFCGFKVNSGEYKLMGLAPYGEPKYADAIRENLVDIKEDGSFRLNMDYFNFLGGLTMTNNNFARLFGGPPRKPESLITRREMDLASSIQLVAEEMMLRMADRAKRITGERNLCLAGGVALNCVANGKLLRSNIFEKIWIQPASGDAGGALGAAMYAAFHIFGEKRVTDGGKDMMRGAYLGPEFPADTIEEFLKQRGYPFRKFPGREEWAREIAALLADGKIIGLHQGRMEYGPRSLGNRSIIGDPRNPRMQSVMNLKIKYRESFRPFAPSCLRETASEYFDLETESPYMLLVAPVKEDRRFKVERRHTENLIEWVNDRRSDLPAVTHVDYSARIQTVDREVNPNYHLIISAFKALTGCGVIVNTSFNVRGEPIVCTPEDAYRCFMRSDIDHLVLENFILDKNSQPKFEDTTDWRSEFVLD